MEAYSLRISMCPKNFSRRDNNKMKNLGKLITMTKSMILIILLCFGLPTRASGVFEFELVNLQQIDAVSRINDNTASSTNSKLIEDQETDSTQKQATISNGESSALSAPDQIRIFVCLKEAFTSKLDGPCTFGNASLTLSRDSIQRERATSASIRAPHDHAPTAGKHPVLAQQQLTQGSLMTNIVRIPFTFRWTKSFTIILTAEQLDVDDQFDDFSRSPQRDQIPHTSGSDTGGNKFRFIDRHVLTENEVLPNLETDWAKPDSNKPWSTRFSRSLKSSLAYRFRIYCSLNYYGDGCTTFCRARDDQFGHYNCSTTGQKVCLEGWQGPDCDKAKCRAGCNQQHGYCDKPDTCQCRPGWTGLRCDECITYPGCQNGYCLGPWQCICQRNWGGVLCDQDLNFCGTHEPCKNNGTCQNIAPGKYKCSCPPKFTGVDCDINLDLLHDAGKMTQLSAGCALNPCLNGGTCFGFNSASVGIYVRDSKINDTLDALKDDNERGKRIYRCQCPHGWTGDYCQWPDSSTMSATTILLNSTQTNGQQANISENDTAIPIEVHTYENESKASPFTTSAFTESSPLLTSPPHLDMKHLISGVVIASVIGVFLASLLLAWCCLVAIERNKFPFIQMNIIRSSDDAEDGQSERIVSVSTLRRMHGKIRDSLRLPSRSRIKPETKLSIENVLKPPRPPPSYEESSSNYQHVNRISIEYPIYHRY